MLLELFCCAYWKPLLATANEASNDKNICPGLPATLARVFDCLTNSTSRNQNSVTALAHGALQIDSEP